MNIMSKLFTAVRGNVREAAMSMIDLNSLRIFEQEIIDSECHVRQAKQDLAHMIAERLCLQREIKALEHDIQHKEAQIVQYLGQNNEQQALLIAEAVAEQKHFLTQQQQRCQQLQSHEDRLKHSLQQTIYRLENYRTELRCLRATANVQKSRGHLAQNTQQYQGRFMDMQDSLQRIRQKQQDFEDRMEALDQVDTELSYFTVQPPFLNTGKHKENAEDILAQLRTQARSTEK